jgi:hypothetical protein
MVSNTACWHLECGDMTNKMTINETVLLFALVGLFPALVAFAGLAQ